MGTLLFIAALTFTPHLFAKSNQQNTLDCLGELQQFYPQLPYYGGKKAYIPVSDHQFLILDNRNIYKVDLKDHQKKGSKQLTSGIKVLLKVPGSKRAQQIDYITRHHSESAFEDSSMVIFTVSKSKNLPTIAAKESLTKKTKDHVNAYILKKLQHLASAGSSLKYMTHEKNYTFKACSSIADSNVQKIARQLEPISSTADTYKAEGSDQ